MKNTDDLKRDNRSPKDIAKAILNHELAPPTDTEYGMTFREQLLYNWGADAEGPGQPRNCYIVRTLKLLEEGKTLKNEEVGTTIRQDLPRILQLLHLMREDLRTEISEDQKTAKSEKDLFLRREAINSLEDSVINIINLDKIEKLARTLASKLGIPLIEPGRTK